MLHGERGVFTLENGLTAVCAAPNGERIYATDGQNCNIYVFDSAGKQLDTLTSRRPYRNLRINCTGEGYTALSCCSGDMYFLDKDFRETDSIRVARAACTSESPTDAAVIGCGRLCVAFSDGAYIYNELGLRERICRAASSEVLTDFICFAEDSYAFCTVCGGVQTLTVSERGRQQSANLSHTYVLRMLFREGERVCGLFGKDYTYCRIMTVYEGKVLSLPR